MQSLEVSGAVRLIYVSLGVKRLIRLSPVSFFCFFFLISSAVSFFIIISSSFLLCFCPAFLSSLTFNRSGIRL